MSQIRLEKITTLRLIQVTFICGAGELLSLNFQVTYDKTMSKLLQDSETFGLGWLGSGVTIKQTPLINILIMCINSFPTAVYIVDCTSHMSEGGKKCNIHDGKIQSQSE